MLRDLRYALRTFAKSPGFAAVAVATLALGIGANTAIFSVVQNVLLRPLPYRDAGRLISIQTIQQSTHQQWAASPPDFYELRARNRSLDQLASFYTRPWSLTGGQEPERVRAMIVSSNFFAALGLEPALGRGFLPADEEWGSHRVAVLSDGLWRQRFGADRSILGRVIQLDSQPYLVVGIAPPELHLPGIDAALFAPMSFAPGDNLNTHNNYFLSMIGRLKPGMTRAQALSDLTAIMRQIELSHPENLGLGLEAETLKEALTGRARPALLVLIGATGFVLLIACANVANLLLARAVGRQREISIRIALGAGRARLLRQFLTEGIALAALGGGAGLLLASWGVSAVHRLSPRVLPRVEEVRVDPIALAFTLALCLVTGILFELAPALQGSAAAAKGAMRGGARATAGVGRRRLRGALIVAEVASSLVLLAGAGLLVKSIHRLLEVHAGFEPRHALTAEIDLSPQKYIDQRLEREQSRQAFARASLFLDTIVGRLSTLPGVRTAGAISSLPLAGESWGKNVTFYDRPLPSNVADLPPIQYRVVAGDYFRAAGVRILSGRAFTPRDVLGAPDVAIVNRELVRRYWNGEDPIGKVLSVNPPADLVPAGTLPPNYQGPEKFTVVGVADDVHYGSLASPPLPLVYVAYSQGAEGQTQMFLVVRSDGDPLALAGAIRQQVWQIDRDQPIARVAGLEAQLGDSVAQPRLEAALLASLAALALVLAGLGIYGVMAYSVSQGIREIGIRIALGAVPGDVTAMVLGEGFRLTAIGLAVGMAGALALTRLLRSLLFGVSATDPLVFGAIVAVLAAVALLASFLPARRAARVDPIVALRCE